MPCVARAESVSAAPLSAAASTAAAEPGVGEALEPAGALDVVLGEDVDEVLDGLLVRAVVEERGCEAVVSGAAGTSDAMDVVINVTGEVVVDHMDNVGDVEATRRHVGGDEHRRPPSTEGRERVFALALCAIAVDRGGHELAVAEPVLEHVGGALGLHEDERETGDRLEQIDEHGLLVVLLDKLELLCDELGRRAHASDGHKDVIVEEVHGHTLDLLREGCREHERLALGSLGHTLLLYDASDLRLESHVEHPVGLVEGEDEGAGDGDARALDEVDETARRRDEQLASTLEVAQLLADVRAAVADDGARAREVAELARLVVDLDGELTRGGEDERQRVGLARRRRLLRPEEPRDHRQEERGRLTRSGLCARHQVAADDRDGDRILLDGRRLGVAGELDVLIQDSGQVQSLEARRRRRAVTAGRFDWDVIVLVKVDTRLLTCSAGRAEDVELPTLVALALGEGVVRT